MSKVRETRWIGVPRNRVAYDVSYDIEDFGKKALCLGSALSSFIGEEASYQEDGVGLLMKELGQDMLDYAWLLRDAFGPEEDEGDADG